MLLSWPKVQARVCTKQVYVNNIGTEGLAHEDLSSATFVRKYHSHNYRVSITTLYVGSVHMFLIKAYDKQLHTQRKIHILNESNNTSIFVQ